MRTEVVFVDQVGAKGAVGGVSAGAAVDLRYGAELNVI